MESRLQIARDCFVIQDLPFREVLSTDFQRPLLAAIRLRIRVSRKPRRQLRAPGVRLVLAQVLRAGGIFLRSNQQPADGL